MFKFATKRYRAIDQDEGLPGGASSKMKSQHRFRRSYQLEDLLVAAIISAGTTAAFLILAAWFWSNYIQTQPTSFVPNFAHLKPVVFNQDNLFVNGNATDNWKLVWDKELFPLDGGFISITHPERYSLSGGFPIPHKPSDEAFSVSMFHQFHCLAALRKDSIALLEANKRAVLGIPTQEVVVDVKHSNHCWDYIRQAIMCAGDTALEPMLVKPDGTKDHRVDGWGAVHQCRDFKAVVEWVEKHGDGSHVWLQEWMDGQNHH